MLYENRNHPFPPPFIPQPRKRYQGSKERTVKRSLRVRTLPDRRDHEETGLVNSDPVGLQPRDFSTRGKVSQVVCNLLAECQGSDAAAALIPWFCDSLQSPSSRKDYHDDLRAFFTAMQAQGVHPFGVTGDHVRLYKEAMVQAEKKSATIARALSVIRGAYEQFGKKGFVPWDNVGDIQSVTAPRVEKNSTPSMTENEAIRLLEAPDVGTVIGLRDQAMLFVYFKTACRSSAIRNAKVGDLECTDTEWYIVVTEKGQKRRRMALLDSAGVVLRWLDAAGIGDDPDSPLFPALANDRKTSTGRHLSGRAVLNLVKKYAEQVNLQVERLGRRGICTHSLRKTAINSALKHGARLEHTQAMAGHEDIRTTQGYVEYHEQDAETAARASQIRPRQV